MAKEGANLETEQELLRALESGKVVTQMSLSKRLGVSIGLVNALIKRAVRKGYVKVRTAPYKRYAYYLTPEGFSEKCRLVVEYLDFSLNFFRRAKQDYLAVFQQAQSRGARRFALIGAGELAEIAYLAAVEADAEIVAVVDAETTRRRIAGAPVAATLEEIGAVDALVITDQSAPQDVYDAYAARGYAELLLTPRLLGLALAREADAPSAAARDMALEAAAAGLETAPGTTLGTAARKSPEEESSR